MPIRKPSETAASARAANGFCGVRVDFHGDARRLERLGVNAFVENQLQDRMLIRERDPGSVGEFVIDRWLMVW